MLTIGIKTFCRPKTLNECLNTIFKKNNTYYPIIIADDSLTKYKLQNLKIINKYKKIYKNIEVINLPFDSGLSKGRNAIVSKCITKYIMILDDSRTFTSKLKINNMIQFLEENNKYHLFCGVINNRIRQHQKYSALFYSIKIIDNIINIKTMPTKKIKSNLFKNLEETNIGVNVFIAKTKCLKNVKWNSNLKIGEHELFFHDFYKFGYRCVISEDCNFNQVSIRHYPEDLKKYRDRAYNIFSPSKIIKIHFNKPIPPSTLIYLNNLLFKSIKKRKILIITIFLFIVFLTTSKYLSKSIHL